jgi:glycosyltransferase involved in cell wall biosynthesis
MTPAISLNSISEDAMADMYRASNVLLAATCSEGCGVPILEAQLCGCPVITTRATAMWEETLLGISVKPQQWIARMDFNSGWYLHRPTDNFL